MNMNEQPANPAAAIPAWQRSSALWIIAILLAIIATALIVRPLEPLSIQRAFGGEPPVAGARGVYAFTGQLADNRHGLFMMDVDNGTVWCYEYVPATRKLVLVAARTYRYDRYLEDFNNDAQTSPDVIQQRLRDQSRIKERIEGGQGPAAEEDGALGTEVPGFPYQPGGGERNHKESE